MQRVCQVGKTLDLRGAAGADRLLRHATVSYSVSLVSEERHTPTVVVYVRWISRRGMVRFGAEGLATFRAVNAVQANLLATAIVKDCEGIAIGDADDFAGEVLSGDDSGEEEKDGSPTVTPTYRHDAGGDDGLQLK